MIKRRGVIAALFAGLGGFYNRAKAQGAQGVLGSNGTFTLTFQKGSVAVPNYFQTCKAHPESATDTSAFTVCEPTRPPMPEPEFALVVKYGDREVRLSAAEIMDALESK